MLFCSPKHVHFKTIRHLPLALVFGNNWQNSQRFLRESLQPLNYSEMENKVWSHEIDTTKVLTSGVIFHLFQPAAEKANRNTKKINEILKIIFFQTKI